MAFNEMGLDIPQLSMPEVQTGPVNVPQLQAPQVDQSFGAHLSDFTNRPGFTEGMLAFGAALMQGKDIGTAGLALMSGLNAAEKEESLKEQHERQQRLLAAQQMRENDWKERQVRATEAQQKTREGTLEEKKLEGAHSRSLGDAKLADQQTRTGIQQQAETRLGEQASVDAMKTFAEIDKLDTQSAALDAELNAPKGVDTATWAKALSTVKATAPTNEFGQPSAVEVGDVLRTYNSLSGTPTYLKIDSSTLRSKVEEGAEIGLTDKEEVANMAEEIEDLYGRPAAIRFGKAVRKKIEAEEAKLRKSGQYKKPEKSMFDTIFGS